MTSDDLALASKWYGIQPIYGQTDARDSFSHVAEANVHVVKEECVDLDLSINESESESSRTNEPVLSASWLSIEGNSPNEKGEFPMMPKDLTPRLTQYYGAITLVILDGDNDLVSKALDDIESNPKLASLLPLFVTFIRNGIQRHLDKNPLVSRFLRLLNSLFKNPYLNFSPKPYLSHLVTALLSCLIPDKSGSLPLNKTSIEHVNQASAILAKVLKKWATPVNQLESQTHQALKDFLLKNESGGVMSHYGALTALTWMGAEAVRDNLMPLMKAYVSKVDAFRGEEHNLIFKTLLVAARTALNPFNYRHLYELFGDSLSVSPLNQSEIRAQKLPDKEIVGKLRIKRLKVAEKKSPNKKSESKVVVKPVKRLGVVNFKNVGKAKAVKVRGEKLPQQINHGHKTGTSSVVIAGKRLSYPKTTERFKLQRMKTCSISTVL